MQSFSRMVSKRIKVLAAKKKKKKKGKKLRLFRGHEIPVHKAVESA